jgi:hypothetical protein
MDEGGLIMRTLSVVGLCMTTPPTLRLPSAVPVRWPCVNHVVVARELGFSILFVYRL